MSSEEYHLCIEELKELNKYSNIQISNKILKWFDLLEATPRLMIKVIEIIRLVSIGKKTQLSIIKPIQSIKNKKCFEAYITRCNLAYRILFIKHKKTNLYQFWSVVNHENVIDEIKNIKDGIFNPMNHGLKIIHKKNKDEIIRSQFKCRKRKITTETKLLRPKHKKVMHLPKTCGAPAPLKEKAEEEITRERVDIARERVDIGRIKVEAQEDITRAKVELEKIMREKVRIEGEIAREKAEEEAKKKEVIASVNAEKEAIKKIIDKLIAKNEEEEKALNKVFLESKMNKVKAIETETIEVKNKNIYNMIMNTISRLEKEKN